MLADGTRAKLAKLVRFVITLGSATDERKMGGDIMTDSLTANVKSNDL